jgi:hypothetical protein
MSDRLRSGPMKDTEDTMLGRHDPASIERALNETSPPPFPPASDRAAWGGVREAVGEDRVSELLARARADAQAEIPCLQATLYLEFSRVGSREGYEGPANRRREMLSNLALAECLEGEGRFLDPLLDVAWAVCEESSWSWPAHQRDLADMAYPVIDLSAAMTALYLAEFDLLLGDRLDPALGRRCLAPYLERHDHPWLFDSPDRPVNNWTAVCNAGVAGAVIYLQTRQGWRRSWPAQPAPWTTTYPPSTRTAPRKDQHTGLTASATTPSSPISWDTARAGRWIASRMST